MGERGPVEDEVCEAERWREEEEAPRKGEVEERRSEEKALEDGIGGERAEAEACEFCAGRQEKGE